MPSPIPKNRETKYLAVGSQVHLKNLGNADFCVPDGPQSVCGNEACMRLTRLTRKNELFELAHESTEYGTQPLVHWFLKDQVEAAKDSRWHLLALDGQLAQRA